MGSIGGAWAVVPTCPKNRNLATVPDVHQVARLVGSAGVLRKTLCGVFGVGFALALAACDGPKHAECEKLMGVINRGLDQIETSQQQLKNNPDRTVELRAMADALEKLAAEAGAVPLEG